MKLFVAVTFLASLGAIAALEEPVVLKNGLSPDRKYEVVLESDKDTPGYQHYDFKERGTGSPAFLIREAATGKVLKRVPWDGDPQSDEQPLRTHAEVSWSPLGHSVILSTTERFYSYSSIWTLDAKSGSFRELALPDYKTMTGRETPSSDNLRARGSSISQWKENGDLAHEIILHPIRLQEGDDTMHHKVTLRLEAKGWKVIEREELKK